MKEMMIIALGLGILFLFWMVKLGVRMAINLVRWPLWLVTLPINLILSALGRDPIALGMIESLNVLKEETVEKIERASYNVESAQQARLWIEEMKKEKANKKTANPETINA